MPELPEVEHLRRELDPVVTGQTITAVPVAAPERWHDMRDAAGCTITATSRRGKYLHLHLREPGHDDLLAIIHLGMTGHLALIRTAPAPDTRHLRWHAQLTGGCHLVLTDPRGFGFARLAHPDELSSPPWSTATYGRLGPDPLAASYDPDAIGTELARLAARVTIKSVLLDQRAIAGVGNYLADEALWTAGIHPSATAISPADGTRLATAVQQLVTASLAHGGVSVRDYLHADGSAGSYADRLAVYGRAGEPCITCATPLGKTTVAGRGTTWCPTCQPTRPRT